MPLNILPLAKKFKVIPTVCESSFGEAIRRLGVGRAFGFALALLVALVLIVLPLLLFGIRTTGVRPMAIPKSN